MITTATSTKATRTSCITHNSVISSANRIHLANAIPPAQYYNRVRAP